MRLGAHVSIAGGLHLSFSRGEMIGCTAIQIFTKNQVQWKARELLQEEISLFKSESRKSPIQTVIAHNSYLINLGSPDPSILAKSRESFSIEMERAEALEIPFLVFHPGSHMDAGEDTGIKTIADSLNLLLDQHPDFKLKLLLEITAGQGSNLGYRFEQLAAIINRVNQKQRLAVCFDTAHAFAAGYDIRTKKGYEETWKEFDRVLGLESLNAFHLNDSKKEHYSRVDRHEHIGKGVIGLDAFRFILNDPRFIDIPKVLETPGTEEDFKRNIDLLKSLIEN